MIAAVPVPTAETMPVTEPTVAAAVLLLLHVPIVGASDRIVVVPVQRAWGPRMGPGCRFTVTMVVAMQLAGVV